MHEGTIRVIDHADEPVGILLNIIIDRVAECFRRAVDGPNEPSLYPDCFPLGGRAAWTFDSGPDGCLKARH